MKHIFILSRGGNLLFHKKLWIIFSKICKSLKHSQLGKYPDFITAITHAFITKANDSVSHSSWHYASKKYMKNVCFILNIRLFSLKFRKLCINGENNEIQILYYEYSKYNMNILFSFMYKFTTFIKGPIFSLNKMNYCFKTMFSFKKTNEKYF